MLATKVACPRCGAGLKSAQPLPAGKTVKCPKCGVPFTVPGEGAAGPSRSGPAVPPPLSAQGVQRMPPPPPLAVPPPAAAPAAGLNTQRLGIVLGGSFVYLAVGMTLALYCWNLNHQAEAAARSRAAAAAPPKKENAEPPLNPLPKEEQAAVELSINRGVRFLKTSQHPNGTWGGGGQHAVGHAAFPGLSLLECGVPANDPNVRKAAEFVRAHAPNLSMTYDLALSILFLDRLGDPKDKELIQTFALRLIAGQTATGGWTYTCPILSPGDHTNLLTVLQGLRPKSNELYTLFQGGGLATAKDPGGVTTSTEGDKDLDVMGARKPPPEFDKLPPNLKNLPVLQDSADLKQGRRAGDNSDNSNTQFGLLGMWVSRRHDVPVERAMALIVKRFRTSQDPGDGSWHYKARQNVGPLPTMTCAGLLGLAVGHGLANEGKADHKADGDPAIDRGLRQLSHFIGEPSGQPVRSPANNDPRWNLYYLWSVERVGVLYNLQTINQKQWYRWGTEFLVGAQNKDQGSWDMGQYPGAVPAINTCFALLFLRQANLAKDLTSKLQLLKRSD